MLHVIAKILTCFELNIINDLLHVNFSFINRRSELNKTFRKPLSEVIIVHPVLIYNPIVLRKTWDSVFLRDRYSNYPQILLCKE